ARRSVISVRLIARRALRCRRDPPHAGAGGTAHVGSCVWRVAFGELRSSRARASTTVANGRHPCPPAPLRGQHMGEVAHYSSAPRRRAEDSIRAVWRGRETMRRMLIAAALAGGLAAAALAQGTLRVAVGSSGLIRA